MSGKKHHIHANIRRLGAATPNLFERAGFMLDPFVQCENSYAPPIHYAVESDNSREAQTAWAAAVDIVQADPDFEGYIEYETLSSRFEANIESKPYEPDRPFPLPKLQLTDVPLHKHKRADLHVKRAAAVTHDQLDVDLLNAGFYEVHTDRNRIYTLQCEDATDAKQIFNILQEFLNVAGGAKQVNFEVIGKFLRKPENLHLPKFLPRQQTGYWYNLHD